MKLERRPKLSIFQATLLLGSVCGALPLFAAPKTIAPKPAVSTVATRPEVKIQLNAYRVERENGREKLVSAESAKPGDIIEYQARYTNSGNAAARDLKPQIPVPNSLTYIGNSARPVQVWATTDAKTFAPVPLKRQVKAANGSIKTVLVPMSEYRSLRWNAGTLAAGKSVFVKARVRVDSN